MLLNSCRGGMRIRENWKLILARSFSPLATDTCKPWPTHIVEVQTQAENKSPVFSSLLTLSVSWSTSLPETAYRTCLTIPAQRPSRSLASEPFYLRHPGWSLFLELDQLPWPDVSKPPGSGYFRTIPMHLKDCILICFKCWNVLVLMKLTPDTYYLGVCQVHLFPTQ